MAGVVVRDFEPGDRDAVRRLHHRALAHIGADRGAGPWDDDLDDVASSYVAVGGRFVVAVADGVIVGMGALSPASEPGSAQIRRMRVDPSWQGRGVGRAVLAELERSAVASGVRRLVLDTTVGQQRAVAFYRAAGYIEARRGTGPSGEATLWFEKEVATR